MVKAYDAWAEVLEDCLEEVTFEMRAEDELRLAWSSVCVHSRWQGTEKKCIRKP